VVKASFSLQTSPMTPAAVAEPFHASDVHHRGQPMAHVTAASDYVPWKTRIDVTALGHACAVDANPAPEVNARFALLAEGKPLFDKPVRAVGERAGPDAAPRPFTKMPIVYERAYGGSATPANPIGRGTDDDEQPNLVDPTNVWRPAGYGPISSLWPLRARRLGVTMRRALDAPIVELPPTFDTAYFQSAPQDQQIAELPPDAVVVLEGFDPGRARVEVALPLAMAVGAAYGLDAASPDAPTPIAFRADTLHVDADRWLATITFRGLITLRDEAQIGELLVAAGVGVGGRDPLVPVCRPQAAGESAPGAAPAPEASPTGTLDLPAHAVPPRDALPFSQEPPAQATLAIDIPASVMAASVPIAPAILGPPRRASDFFHDPSKLRADGTIARVKDEAPAPPKPEEEVDLERYARVSAACDEPGARKAEVLAAEQIEPATFRKAELYWRRALDGEAKQSERALRERYDDAYVGAWEAAHPEKFGMAEYARLLRAEKKGRLAAEVEAQKLDPALAMRFRRVWKRRVADRGLRRQLEERLRQLVG
jgi:hypothetical protein